MRGITQSTPSPTTLSSDTTQATPTTALAASVDEAPPPLQPGTAPQVAKKPRLAISAAASADLRAKARELLDLNAQIVREQAEVGRGRTTPELEVKKIARNRLVATAEEALQTRGSDTGTQASQGPTLAFARISEQLAINALNRPNGLQELMDGTLVIHGFHPDALENSSPELQIAFLSASVRSMEGKRQQLLRQPATPELIVRLRDAEAVIRQSSAALHVLHAARDGAGSAIARRLHPAGMR